MSSLHNSGRKHLFPRGPGLGLRFVLLAAAAGSLLYLDLHGLPLSKSTREWTAWALQPVTWVSTLPHALDDIGDNFESRGKLRQENAALKQRELVLSGQLLKMQALEAENQRIRALLSSSTSIEHRVLIAEILQTSQDPYRHQILLNKGSQEGVYQGQALVDAYGVLGQVVQVHPNDAVALLITDPDNGVPVEINRTGLQTVALGRGDGQNLSLPFLPGNADVHVGDLLVSSGLGGRFPPGYPVGRVRELKRPSGDSFMEAIADPTAHLNRSRQVLLVWSQATSATAPASLPVDLQALAPNSKRASSGHKPPSKKSASRSRMSQQVPAAPHHSKAPATSAHATTHQ